MPRQSRFTSAHERSGPRCCRKRSTVMRWHCMTTNCVFRAVTLPVRVFFFTASLWVSGGMASNIGLGGTATNWCSNLTTCGCGGRSLSILYSFANLFVTLLVLSPQKLKSILTATATAGSPRPAGSVQRKTMPNWPWPSTTTCCRARADALWAHSRCSRAFTSTAGAGPATLMRLAGGGGGGLGSRGVAWEKRHLAPNLQRPRAK